MKKESNGKVNSDMLPYACELERAMASEPSELIVLRSVGSTNTYAKELLRNAKRGEEATAGAETAGRVARERSLCVVADEQTGGRGRRARRFHSPAGAGVYMSYAFTPAFGVTEIGKVTPIAAALVHRALSRFAARSPHRALSHFAARSSSSKLSIKWVNDLYLDGLKVTGILTEALPALDGTIEHIIIGIGINCFDAPLPDELAGVAGSLFGELTPADGDRRRAEIAAAVLHELELAFSPVASGNTLDATGELHEYYEQHCAILGQRITVIPYAGESYTATALSINEAFELVVLPDNAEQEIALSTAEVSLETHASFNID